MSKDFCEICKSVVGKLELTKEQGIARDVILNMLDMKEEESKDYLTRINKAMEKLYCWGEVLDAKFQKEMLEILVGDIDDE